MKTKKNKIAIFGFAIILFFSSSFVVFSKQELIKNYRNGRSCANMSLKIIYPEERSTESGIVLIAAEQKKSINASHADSVLFEYSQNKKDWTLIKEQTDSQSSTKGLSLKNWDVRWDTTELSPGMYYVRATTNTVCGITKSSPARKIMINRAPIAIVTATLAGHELPELPVDNELSIEDVIPVEPGTVLFDGSTSEDEDGFIKNWTWDFGDGTFGSGESVEHLYIDFSLAFDISLTVEDNLGLTSTSHYTISFLPEFMIFPDPKCICKSIELRGDNKDLPGEKNALGPDGAAGGTDWGKSKDWDDGKTLGPLNDNPENKKTGKEKKWTGYAFEVLATIEGNPALCDQMQVVKYTVDGWDVKWKGTTADLDKDGIDDIDISSEKKCEDAGGVWDATAKKCTLEFPQNKANYGPDTPEDTDAGGAYENPFSYKKHPDKKIIWYDTPGFSGAAYPNGTKGKANFISYVRGTDNKYCYVKHTLELEKKAGKDSEKLTEDASANSVNSIPGLP